MRTRSRLIHSGHQPTMTMLADKLQAVLELAREIQVDVILRTDGARGWCGILDVYRSDGSLFTATGSLDVVVDELTRGLENLKAGRVADRDGPVHLVIQWWRVCSCGPDATAEERRQL